MLHSGSRNIGKALAEVHMARARKLAHNRALVDRDLAVFLAGTPEMAAYRRDLFWAQRYAMLNRAPDVRAVMQVDPAALPRRSASRSRCSATTTTSPRRPTTARQLLVTRKGAISARAGQLGIIPGSMGTRSYIVRGLGNAESLHSASHGAGRRMSRGEAKRRFSVKDLAEQTAGVECRKDGGVLDEIPGAYKPIEQVMENQQDLVEVVAELKQVLCVKG